MEQQSQIMVEMGIRLTELAFKRTASTIEKKLRSSREEKDIEKLRSTYDEIINELISEREEAVRLAQAYKSELDRIVISDDDINHLHSTITKMLGIMGISQIGTTTTTNIDQIKDLITADTLKTMQLLGFNYKAAIGEPLTEVCAEAILSLKPKKSNSKQQHRVK